MNTGAPTPRRRNLALPLLLAVVLLPVAVAAFLHLSGWRPPRTTAQGEILSSPAPLPALDLIDASGAPASLAALQGKWTLLYLLPRECAEPCVRSLYAMRLAHLGQGRDTTRVARMVVAGDPAQAAGLAARDPQLAVLTATPDQLAALRQRLDTQADGQPGVHLVDPRARAVLRYRPDTQGTAMLRDLTHLLKHSWIG